MSLRVAAQGHGACACPGPEGHPSLHGGHVEAGRRRRPPDRRAPPRRRAQAPNTYFHWGGPQRVHLVGRPSPSLPRLLMLSAGSLFMPSCHFSFFVRPGNNVYQCRR